MEWEWQGDGDDEFSDERPLEVTKHSPGILRNHEYMPGFPRNVVLRRDVRVACSVTRVEHAIRGYERTYEEQWSILVAALHEKALPALQCSYPVISLFALSRCEFATGRYLSYNIRKWPELRKAHPGLWPLDHGLLAIPLGLNRRFCGLRTLDASTLSEGSKVAAGYSQVIDGFLVASAAPLGRNDAITLYERAFPGRERTTLPPDWVRLAGAVEHNGCALVRFDRGERTLERGIEVLSDDATASVLYRALT